MNIDHSAIMSAEPTHDLIQPPCAHNEWVSIREQIPHRLLKSRVRRWSKKNADFLWVEYRKWLEIFDTSDDSDLMFRDFSRISYINVWLHLTFRKIVDEEIEVMTSFTGAKTGGSDDGAMS